MVTFEFFFLVARQMPFQIGALPLKIHFQCFYFGQVQEVLKFILVHQLRPCCRLSRRILRKSRFQDDQFLSLKKKFFLSFIILKSRDKKRTSMWWKLQQTGLHLAKAKSQKLSSNLLWVAEIRYISHHLLPSGNWNRVSNRSSNPAIPTLDQGTPEWCLHR